MRVKLAVTIMAMYATLLSEVFGGDILEVMVSARVGTLCGDTEVCLIENNGDIGRTMRDRSRRDVVKNVARSMLTT